MAKLVDTTGLGEFLTKLKEKYVVLAKEPSNTALIRKNGNTVSVTSTIDTSSNIPTSTAVKTYVDNKSGVDKTGTVTSVGISVPGGFTVTGSPVTSSGTIAITFDKNHGYGIPPDTMIDAWNDAVGVVNSLGSTYAKLESPTFTGTPTAPTASAGNNSTQIATTAFVNNEIANKFAANDAMQFKGVINSSTSNVTTATNWNSTSYTYGTANTNIQKGWTWKIGVAGYYTFTYNNGLKYKYADSPTVSGVYGTYYAANTMIIAVYEGAAPATFNFKECFSVVLSDTENVLTYDTYDPPLENALVAFTAEGGINTHYATETGTSIKPIYINREGVPTACAYSLSKDVPANAVFTDTTYSTATASTLGLVKIGYTQSGQNYPVQLSNGQMYVNVPWTDTTYEVATTSEIDALFS